MVNDWYAEVEKLQLKYIVVTKDGVNKLAEEVNCLIARGYLPQGGISVNSHNIYTQAMIMNGEKVTMHLEVEETVYGFTAHDGKYYISLDDLINNYEIYRKVKS